MTIVRVKDRAITEQRILKAVDRIVATEGFEGLGITAVAKEAGVSKMLIYRYFGNCNDLITHYVLQGDFWSNVEIDINNKQQLRERLQSLFRQQIVELRTNVNLRRLIRWELITQNKLTDFLFDRREKNGSSIITQICQVSQASREEISALSAILTAALSYLALIGDRYPQYSEVELQTDAGWQSIERGLWLIIDMWLERIEKNPNPPQQNNKLSC